MTKSQTASPTLKLIRSALQDAICWEQSRIHANCGGHNNLNKYEKLLADLGQVTREKAFVRQLKADGAKAINIFDMQPYVGKHAKD